MPVIPRIQTAGPSTVRAINADVGGAVSDLGRVVSDIDAKMGRARRARELNEAVTEATRRVSQSESDLQADPGSFASWNEQQADFLKSTRDELSDQLGDVAVRDAFNQRFNTMSVHSEARVRQGSRKLEISEGVSALDELDAVSAANYASSVSPVDRRVLLDGQVDSVEAAAENGLITPVQAADRVRSFAVAVERQRALADIDKDPVFAAAGIAEGAYDLTEDDRRVASQRAQRGIEALAAQERRDQADLARAAAIEEAWDFVDLMDLGDQGLLQTEATEAFRTKYQATRSGAREWLQLRGESRSIADGVLAQQAVTNALTGDGFISPDSRDQMKAVDTVYKTFLTRWDPAEIPEKTAQFAARLGVVPDTMRDIIIGPLGTMHDPDAVVLASEIVASIDKQNPAALGGFHKEHIKKAVEIQAYTQGGLTPKGALELFNAVREVPTAVTDSRDREFGKFVRDGDFESNLTGAIDAAFDVAAPPEMVARAEAVVRDNYKVHGNFEVAIQQGVAAARTTWGASMMDDDILQFDAPGLNYGAPGKDDEQNREWQQEQLTDNIGDSPDMSALAARVSGDLIVTTHPTLRAADGKPVYSIAGVSESDGTLIAIGNWVPDYQSSKQFVRDTRDDDEIMQALYADRKQFLRSPAQRRQASRARATDMDREARRYQELIADSMKEAQFQRDLATAGGS